MAPSPHWQSGAFLKSEAAALRLRAMGPIATESLFLVLQFLSPFAFSCGSIRLERREKAFTGRIVGEAVTSMHWGGEQAGRANSPPSCQQQNGREFRCM